MLINIPDKQNNMNICILNLEGMSVIHKLVDRFKDISIKFSNIHYY